MLQFKNVFMPINKYGNTIKVNVSLFTNTYPVRDNNKIIATISIFLNSAALRRRIRPLQ